MIKVLFVCHGNICRSTMAQSVFEHMVKEQGIKENFFIDSAATSREEIGNPPHHGTVRKLKEKNIPVIPHKATQITKQDFDKYDYIIGMDKANIRNIEKIVGQKSEKIRALLSFDNDQNDIADPWYTGDFEITYQDVTRGLKAFLKEIQ